MSISYSKFPIWNSTYPQKYVFSEKFNDIENVHETIKQKVKNSPDWFGQWIECWAVD